MPQMLLRSDVAEKLTRAFQRHAPPTVEQREKFAAWRSARPKLAARVELARPAASTDPENYAVVGSIAQINVDGVLSEELDIMCWWLGIENTAYEDIRDAFALAASDANVTSVILSVSSPGGYVEGLFETLATIEAFKKPITVQASQACSAAYAIAAMAGPITAAGPASEFGSVGVACTYCFDADEEIVDVTSSNAPDKRPDPRTPEGKKVIVAYLDAIEEIFVDGIARGRAQATGRTVTVEDVTTSYGRGAVLLADAAKAAGMIDKMPRATKRGSSASADVEPVAGIVERVQGQAVSDLALSLIAKTSQSAPPAAPAAAAPTIDKPRAHSGQTKEKKPMDLEKLKAEHPELYAQIVAAARAEGSTAERKRVNALVKLGTKFNAMPVAIKAIESGASCMDEEVHSDFMVAAMDRRDVQERQADSDAAGTVLGGAPKTPVAGEEKDLGDKVVESIEAKLGKKLGEPDKK